MENNKFLLYGANGYTGRLIAGLAASYGLVPILAGRKKKEIEALAKELDLDYRIFKLNDKLHLENSLLEVPLVLHAAGPFQYTSKSMIEACLKTNTHYLDITGEIGVFEQAKSYDEKAKVAGLMIMPGVGFDVVPTDCMAKYLKDKLPDADQLKLAFASIGGMYSHGTAMTMAEGLGEGSAARINGKITPQPLGKKGMWLDFGVKKMFVMTIPWGDVSTAYFTTGIPNIETYTAASPKTFKYLKWQKFYNWILRTSFAKDYVKNKIKQKPAGPSAEMREKAMSLIWGEVSNANGQTVSARMVCPEGYTLTAISSLLIVQKVLNDHFKIGYQTPAAVYGADLVLEIPNTKREDIIV
jgi:short subunit dehydrogenase-like uncharacterized protein